MPPFSSGLTSCPKKDVFGAGGMFFQCVHPLVSKMVSTPPKALPPVEIGEGMYPGYSLPIL